MAVIYPSIAGFSSESFTAPQGFALDSDVIDQSATIVSGAGTIVFGQVLGMITASGKLTKHAPAASDGSQIAVAVAAYPVDATSADVVAKVYTAGVFAMDALVYNAATNSDALKLAVFPLTSTLKVRKLAFGS